MTKGRTVAKPYRLLAHFYDQMQTDAPQMNRHAREKVLGKILPRIRSVCDLGCGTGTTAVELARRGLQVYAVDFSPAMCRLARQKARRAGLPVRVICTDMRTFRLPEQVDLVICEFNPINHLPRRADLARAARSVATALRPGGYFYFDLNTQRTYEVSYRATHWFEQRSFCLLMRGDYDPRRKKGWMDLEWFLPEGKLWRRHRERMHDVWWTDQEIRRALRRAGFRNIRFWDAVQVRPPSPYRRPGFDAYYLAQKPLTTRRAAPAG